MNIQTRIMKGIFTIAIIIFNLSSFAQDNSIDSLKKFSYFLFGRLSDKTIIQGTASFIRIKEKIYLMTAAHVLDGWDYATKKSHAIYPDTFYIRLYRTDNDEPEFLSLPVNKIKAERKEEKYFYEKADFIFIEVKIPVNYKVNTIEKFMDCKIDSPSNIFEVVLFGFPVDDSDNVFLHYIQNILPQKATGIVKGNYTDPIRFYENNDIDSLNYIAYYKEGRIKHGHSGSPVYFLYKSSKDSSKYKICFGGLLCIRNESQKYMTIVRPEYIKNVIAPK